MSKRNTDSQSQKHLGGKAWQRLRLIATTLSRRNNRRNPSRVFTIWPATSTAILIASMLMIVLSYYTVDEWVIRWVYSYAPKAARTFFLLITEAGNSSWILVSTGLTCLFLVLFNLKFLPGRRQVWLSGILFDAWFLFLSVAGSGLISLLTKRLVGRARPGSIDIYGFGYFDPFSFSGGLGSFPSGHATTIAALSTMLALRFPKYWWFFVILALLVGASRVIAYKHYPSDVIMGLAIGILFTLTLARIFANQNTGFRFFDGTKAGKTVLRRYVVRGIK